MNSNRLEVQNLKKAYQARKASPFVAVDDVSFSISEGECFGLLGPNGAGKSTTIQCLTGFYPPTSGHVRIDGVDVHEEPKKARTRLGVCAQEDTLDTDFSVLDQLIFHGSYFGLTTRAARQQALDLLREFGLTEKKDKLVEHLSGGMRRRLQVARAFMGEPALLVLDEPTTGLDPDARRGLWEILGRGRKRGISVLLSTHYMDEAERLCDRIAIMSRGKIYDIDTPEQLIKRHIQATTVEEEVRPGVVWKRPPNLEDVFMHLVGISLAGKGKP